MLAPNRRTDVHSTSAAQTTFPVASRSGAPVFTASFPAVVASIPRARRFLARTISPRVGPDALDVALLLGSELVTNAVVHAGTPFAVSVQVGDERLRVAVEDGDDRPPRVADQDVTTPGGFGLLLVDELASGWGVEHPGRSSAGTARSDDTTARSEDRTARSNPTVVDSAGRRCDRGGGGRRPGKTVWFEVEL